MAEGIEQPVFTVKEYLARIDSKQDKLEEKIDKVADSLEGKADIEQFRSLQDRVTITEQQQAARLSAYERLERKVDTNTDRIDQVMQTALPDKADKNDVTALWRVLVGALGGSAVAILAWALQVFVR